MSLSFDLTKIQDYREICYDEDQEGLRYNPVTETVIFACIAVCMHEITKENYIEFHSRLAMASAVMGDSCPVSLQDVKNHIGLKTNAYCRGTGWREFTTKLRHMIETRRYLLCRNQAANN